LKNPARVYTEDSGVEHIGQCGRLNQLTGSWLLGAL